MRNARGLLLLAAPVVGLALLAVALLLRRVAPEPTPPPRPAVSRAPVEYTTPPPAPRSEPAPPETIARAMDDDRLQSTWLNYRTAMATGNRPLADALRTTLARDREKVLAFARKTLEQSTSDDDRRISRMALESLER
jgi:hypothetical protein